MIHVTLRPTPPSTQTIYRHGSRGSYMTQVGVDTKKMYQMEILAECGKKPTKEPISVIVELYFKDEKRRDVDNFNKLILDAGSGLLWFDDSQIQELVIRKFIDKKNPRVELFVML